MLKDRADVGVLVVEPKWCWSDGKTQCDLPTKPVSCPVQKPELNTCGLSTIVQADWKHAYAVVSADCLGSMTIHHEVAHLIGGNHARPTAPHTRGPVYARAYIDADSRLTAPWMTLLGSKMECAKCLRRNMFSSPIGTTVVPRRKELGGGTLVRKLSNGLADNRRAIADRMEEVAEFGETRLRDHCEHNTTRSFIPFRFNVPNLRLAQRSALADAAAPNRQLAELQGEVRDYFELCGKGRLRVVGHADSVPGPYPGYNLELSRERARLVAEWLQEAKAIPAAGVQICVEARGADSPNSSAKDESSRAQNRRVDVYADGETSC
jgi:outer membrane protein OmpA-like peptidoglycan-associated protein